MVTWQTFEEEAPQFAAWVAERIRADDFGHISYLATVRKDGSPRLHPAVGFFSEGRLLLVTSRVSARFADLQRDDRYVLHPPVAADPHLSGDVAVRGRAVRIDDETTRRSAALAAPFVGPAGTEFEVFELRLDAVDAMRWVGNRQERVCWSPGELSEVVLSER